MVLHVNHFAVVTKNYFSKQSQHEDTKAEAITANFIETGDLKQVILNYQEETLLKRSYQKLIPLEKLQRA